MDRPLQFSIYKGKTGRFGAAQFRFIPPVERTDNTKEKTGWIVLEMTSTKAADVYDWENKVVFGLGFTDIYSLLFILRTLAAGSSQSIVHDPNAGTEKKGQVLKTLQVYSKDGVSNGVFLTLTEKSPQGEKQHKVPLTGAETMALATLLQSSIPACLGW